MSPSESKEKLVFEKMYARDYCSQWMGIKLIEIKEGYCKIEMQIKQEMLNGYGILHGGIAYAFADSAFAFASNSYGRIAVSINGNMHFHKSAKLGQTLYAIAKAVSVNHKLATFDVDVMEKTSEQIYYHFRGTVYRKQDTVLDPTER